MSVDELLITYCLRSDALAEQPLGTEILQVLYAGGAAMGRALPFGYSSTYKEYVTRSKEVNQEFAEYVIGPL